jgi:delta-aminolevulinic acid dehydratase/porphobilinogen synthase
MSFPETRMRRLRRSESMRALVRETVLDPSDLIYPLFIYPGEGVRRAVEAAAGEGEHYTPYVDYCPKCAVFYASCGEPNSATCNACGTPRK